MAKIHMAQVAGLPVRTLRRMVGIPAHRPSAFNACIGGHLRVKRIPNLQSERADSKTRGFRLPLLARFTLALDRHNLAPPLKNKSAIHFPIALFSFQKALSLQNRLNVPAFSFLLMQDYTSRRYYGRIATDCSHLLS